MCLFYSDPSDKHSNYVDEHVLYPTLSWTSFFHFSNPLSLPLCNTPHDNEQCKNELYRLTTALTSKQFTHIGYKQTLTIFIAPKANENSIDHCDHHIIRPNEDHFLNDDKFANPQLTEKFFIRTPYVFTLNSLERKHDHIISEALRDIQAYDSNFSKFNNFSLTFHVLTPKERYLHSSYDIIIRTKQTNIYTYYQFIQNHYSLHTPSRQPHHRYQFINSKYSSPLFIYFTYCIKGTNFQGMLRN